MPRSFSGQVPGTLLTEGCCSGWNAPRKSLGLVHPDGEAVKADSRELRIAIDPSPDFAGIAKAAACGKAGAGHARTVEELKSALPEAVVAVRGGTVAVLKAELEPPASF